MMNLDSRQPLVYLITDRLTRPAAADGYRAIFGFVLQSMAAGVDMIQLRQPDLPTRDLVFLTKRLVQSATRYGCRVLVNDRADVAAACGAGVHLRTRSMRPAIVRKTLGSELLIGVSTHSVEEVREAEEPGPIS